MLTEHFRTMATNWSQTATTTEARSAVVDLSKQIQCALNEGRLVEAKGLAERMHILSQNHAILHSYGHWLSARVHRRGGELRPAVRHMYLSVMAPYGTLRRRLRGDRIAPAQVSE